MGRNPRTGDAVDVPAKRVPYFKPGKDMRERLNTESRRSPSELEKPASAGLFMSPPRRAQIKGARIRRSAPLALRPRNDQKLRLTVTAQVRGMPGWTAIRPLALR